ncbi:hypothetical protein CJF32_00011247 [Rutstroemia sp. NJR-2017a WRK4]|nr:hypothetical protein CJF32_00011247 [Rutstroemia sp. NJR-2017a WRK4]
MPTQPTTCSIIIQLQADNANDRTEDLLQRASTKSADKVLDMIQRVELIKLPGSAMDKYEFVRTQPSVLWSSAGIQLDPIKTNVQMTAFFPIYIWVPWEIIVRRFFVLFFRDLGYFSKLSRLQLVDLLSSSSSIQDEKTIIESNIRRWVRSGNRYSRFSELLGSGAPFLLPESFVNDFRWESALCLCSTTYDRAIEYPKSKDFCKIARKLGADTVGRNIRDAIFQPLLSPDSIFISTYGQIRSGGEKRGLEIPIREDNRPSKRIRYHELPPRSQQVYAGLATAYQKEGEEDEEEDEEQEEYEEYEEEYEEQEEEYEEEDEEQEEYEEYEEQKEDEQQQEEHEEYKEDEREKVDNTIIVTASGLLKDIHSNSHQPTRSPAQVCSPEQKDFIRFRKNDQKCNSWVDISIMFNIQFKCNRTPRNIKDAHFRSKVPKYNKDGTIVNTQTKGGLLKPDYHRRKSRTGLLLEISPGRAKDYQWLSEDDKLKVESYIQEKSDKQQELIDNIGFEYSMKIQNISQEDYKEGLLWLRSTEN